jgi:hypothetical protein
MGEDDGTGAADVAAGAEDVPSLIDRLSQVMAPDRDGQRQRVCTCRARLGASDEADACLRSLGTAIHGDPSFVSKADSQSSSCPRRAAACSTSDRGGAVRFVVEPT